MKKSLIEHLAAGPVLSQYGYSILIRDFNKYIPSKEDQSLLFKKLTVTAERKIGPPLISHSYKIERLPLPRQDIVEILTLPRAVATTLVKKGVLPAAKSLFTAAENINLIKANGFEFLPDQELICDHIFNQKLLQNSTAILNFATGYGKTYVAAGIIARAAVTTAVILPHNGLLEQTIEVFSDIWPNATIASFSNSKFPSFRAAKIKVGRGAAAIEKVVDIFVSTIDSWLIAAKTRGPGGFDGLGLIIFDEIHMMGSINRSSIFFNTHVPLMFGMSATTAERADAFDKIYIQHIGPLVRAESIEGFSYDKNAFFGKVYCVKYTGSDEYTAIIKNEKSGLISTGAMVKAMAADDQRNRLIARLTLDELTESSERYIYIFSESLEHLDRIKEKIIETDNGLEATIFKLTGGANHDEIAAVKSAARVILTTYGYGGTGFSITRMNTLIIASPRKRNFMQITGRIFRRGSDSSVERRIYDIIDTRSILRHQFKSRQPVYESRGLSIKWIDG